MLVLYVLLSLLPLARAGPMVGKSQGGHARFGNETLTDSHRSTKDDNFEARF